MNFNVRPEIVFLIANDVMEEMIVKMVLTNLIVRILFMMLPNGIVANLMNLHVHLEKSVLIFKNDVIKLVCNNEK